MATNSHNLNCEFHCVNDIDPESAVHATAAEARPWVTAGSFCSDSMGYDAVQISVARDVDHVIPSEIPNYRAVPIPIRSGAYPIIEHGSVPSSFVEQGSLPLFGLPELDPSPLHSTLERRGNQLHGIPHRDAGPVMDPPRAAWIPIQDPNSQEQSSDVLHFGPIEKGETASHDLYAGHVKRAMSQTGKAELSGAVNHGTDYVRPSFFNQNDAVNHVGCTDKRDVSVSTARRHPQAHQHGVHAVCSISRREILAERLAPTQQGDLMSSGTAATSPPRAFTSEDKNTPALSPVLIVGHHLPSVPIIAIEPSTSLGRSPRVWHSGSCFFLPPTEERTPMLGSFARAENGNSNNAATATHADQNEMLPPNRLFKFSTEQIMILISMLLVDFSSFASMSIMAPFFPQQVDQRGLSPTVDGIIFSVYALVIVLVSPTIGKTLPIMSTKGVYMAGIITAGVANICFGFVVHVKNPEMFVVVAITLRVLVAFGSACFLTVIYTLVPVLFPDDMNTVNGMLETAVGVGMCVGPAVGVWLYSLGGFCLPFYGLGSFILLTVPVNMLTFPKRGDISPELIQGTDAERAPVSEALGLTSILKRPGAVLPLAILSVTAVCLAVLYPTLQPHMHGLGVSVEGVGLVFLLMSAVYAVSSPLVGLATDRYNCPSSFMLAGLLLLTLALILIGNSPLLPNVTHDMLYKQDVVAVVVIGLASAMSIVPTFASILYVLGEDGIVGVTTFSLVGGMWSASYSLGEMLGPLYAGLMAEYVSFATSTTVTALLPASLAVVQGVYMCMECYRSHGRPKSTLN
nr:MFS-type transporter SLC18B1-like [Penaeus vannamei]